jgi:hypothetical protein
MIRPEVLYFIKIKSVVQQSPEEHLLLVYGARGVKSEALIARPATTQHGMSLLGPGMSAAGCKTAT